MHRYLPGILLVQIVMTALVWVSVGSDIKTMAIQIGVPAILLAVVTALWFASIGRASVDRLTTDLRLRHAAEREKLHINAEKTKAKILEKTQREIRRNEKSVGRKASLKVGLAFAGATIAGVIMLITELFTFGLMTITTTLGGMGGYLLRTKQSADNVAPAKTIGQGSTVLIDNDIEDATMVPPSDSDPR